MALVVAARFDWSWIIASLIACIWLPLGLLLGTSDPRRRIPPKAGFPPFRLKFIEAFQSRRTWLGLGFGLLAGAGFEATGALAGPYLIDRGASVEAVGIFYGFPVVIATLIGGLAGGVLVDRYKIDRVVALSLIGWVLMICALAVSDSLVSGSFALA